MNKKLKCKKWNWKKKKKTIYLSWSLWADTLRIASDRLTEKTAQAVARQIASNLNGYDYLWNMLIFGDISPAIASRPL